MDPEKGKIKTKGSKDLMDVFQFGGISRINGIPNNRGVFKFRFNAKVAHPWEFRP
jgi:hypothetical protein